MGIFLLNSVENALNQPLDQRVFEGRRQPPAGFLPSAQNPLDDSLQHAGSDVIQASRRSLVRGARKRSGREVLFELLAQFIGNFRLGAPYSGGFAAQTR